MFKSFSGRFTDPDWSFLFLVLILYSTFTQSSFCFINKIHFADWKFVQNIWLKYQKFWPEVFSLKTFCWNVFHQNFLWLMYPLYLRKMFFFIFLIYIYFLEFIICLTSSSCLLVLLFLFMSRYYSGHCSFSPWYSRSGNWNFKRIFVDCLYCNVEDLLWREDCKIVYSG